MVFRFLELGRVSSELLSEGVPSLFKMGFLSELLGRSSSGSEACSFSPVGCATKESFPLFKSPSDCG